MITTDNIGVNRNYKDRLFRILFSEKKRALELYNGLNHSAYTNEDELEIRTLEDVIWMKMKNDVAYLIRDVLALFEHQSTINSNLPVRGLLYFADLFRGFLKGRHIYGRKLIKLPTPVYIVFYNGDQDIGEETCLKLSDAFIHGNEQSKMELQVQILNVNDGYNTRLMAACPTLQQYAVLIGKIKTYHKKMDLESAVGRAIEECITQGVLREFLMLRRAEVMNSILTEYDEEQVLADIGQENYEEGRMAGIKEGKSAGREEGRSAGLREGRSAGLKEGRSAGLKEGRSAGLKEGRSAGLREGRSAGREEGINAGINALIIDNAEDGKNKEQIIKKLVKRFSLEYDEAKKHYDIYVKNASK